MSILMTELHYIRIRELYEILYSDHPFSETDFEACETFVNVLVLEQFSETAKIPALYSSNTTKQVLFHAVIAEFCSNYRGEWANAESAFLRASQAKLYFDMRDGLIERKKRIRVFWRGFTLAAVIFGLPYWFLLR